MSRLILALALLALTGCATIERHPYVSALVVGSIAATAMAHGHGSRTEWYPMSDPLTLPHDVTTQPFTCTGASCQ